MNNWTELYLSIKFKSTVTRQSITWVLLSHSILQMMMQDEQSQVNVEKVGQLMQLYMIGVELLQSKADKRFNYFYKKIQSLLLKKQVAAQLQAVSGKKMTTPENINKTQMEKKKNEHEIQVYYNQEQYDQKRMKQIIKTAQCKLERYNGKIKNDIQKQQNILAQRLSRRKLKSVSGSKKFIGKQNTPPKNDGNTQKQQQQDTYNQYFANSPQQKKKKVSSIHKLKLEREHSNRKNNFF